jgi:hypothetical protein
MASQKDRELAGRAVFAKILSEEVASLVGAIRKHVEPNLAPGEHVVGQLGDGTRIGKVMVTEQPVTVDIVDEDALVHWILEHRPDEIVPAIRPSYLAYLRDQVKKHGNAFDPESKEIIPGLALGSGTPAYKPVPTEEGRAMVRSKLSELIAGGLLELPPSGES